MPENSITDDEILYRRVPSGRNLYEILSDGTIRLSSQAFYESGHRPSVDRAKLRNYDPKLTLGQFSGGVVSFVTLDVRSITIDVLDKQINSSYHYVVDVEPAPVFDHPTLTDNPAHAEIYTIPLCDKKAFKILRERLLQLANARSWEIVPSDMPPKG